MSIFDFQVGGRLGYSIRGTLQSQSKSFVDNQHNIRVWFSFI
jgi:vacuolar protein sorting-associated protein 54